MPFVADQSAQAQTLGNRKLGQRQNRLPGEHSTTPHARVHIDHHIERHLGAGRRCGDRCDRPLIVDPHHDVCDPGDLHQAFDRGRACDLIGQQDAPDSASGQCFCLAQRGAGDADGARGQLPAGQGHALVVLIVGAQPAWSLGKKCGHLLDVGFHCVHVDQESRCLYLRSQQRNCPAFWRGLNVYLSLHVLPHPPGRALRRR